MPYAVYCPNGHALRVLDGQAGRHGRCPTCHAPFVIPGPTDTLSPTAAARRSSPTGSNAPLAKGPLDDLGDLSGMLGSTQPSPLTSAPATYMSVSGARTSGKRQFLAALRKSSLVLVLVVGACVTAVMLFGAWRLAVRYWPRDIAVSQAERAAVLVVFDGLSHTTEEPDVLGNVAEKFTLGGLEKLVVHEPVADGPFLLVELTLARSEISKITCDDVRLLAGDADSAAVLFLTKRTEPVEVSLVGTSFGTDDDRSWMRILPTFRPLEDAETVIRTEGRGASFDEGTFTGSYRFAYPRDAGPFFPGGVAPGGSLGVRQGFGRTAVAQFRRPGGSNLELTGAVTQTGPPNVQCSYSSDRAVLKWSETGNAWLAATTATAGADRYPRTWSITAVFATPARPPEQCSVRVLNREPASLEF